MPGSTTRTKSRNRDAITFQALQMVPFAPISSSAASQTANTIQASFALPFSAKIFGASITQGTSTYTAASGANFNIVAGTGTYETVAGVNASTTMTVAGTPAAGNTITVIFYIPLALAQSVGFMSTNILGLPGGSIAPVAGSVGIPVSVTLTSAQAASTTTAAAALVQAINTSNAVPTSTTPSIADSNASALLWASNSANAVTVSFLQASTAANSATWTASALGGGATITASGSFASGTATTGVVSGVNDTFEYNGAYVFAPAGAGTLGATPIFNADMPILPVVPAQGYNPYWSTNFDTIYQQGSLITLRIIGTTLTYTNLVATVVLMPFDVDPGGPNMTTFDVHQDIL